MDLDHGIYLLWEDDLKFLDMAKVRYEHREPNSSNVDEIYRAFGMTVQPTLEKPSIFDRILGVLHLY